MSITGTLIVQMIVFLILVWFTMKFVWPPITVALDERAKKIAEGLSAADKAKAELIEADKKVQAALSSAKDDAAKRLVKDIVPLFEAGKGSNIVGVRGTLWAGYNAVTEYLTHHRGHSDATRLESLWFGPAHNQNERAFQVACDLLKAA